MIYINNIALQGGEKNLMDNKQRIDLCIHKIFFTALQCYKMCIRDRVEVDEPSLIKVTTYLKKYSVKADYTITMTYRNGNEANDSIVSLYTIFL